MTTAHGSNDWKIRINGNEQHPLPHAHVIFRDGSRVSICLQTFRVLIGTVRPHSRIVPALAWMREHAAELITEYRRLNP